MKKAAVERMQAKGAIALGAQPPGERGDRRPGKGVIGVEAVVAEILIGDAGQHRKLGAHRIGAPPGDIEPSGSGALIHTGVEARQQVFGDSRRRPARVEERLALHQDQRHVGRGARPPDRRSADRPHAGRSGRRPGRRVGRRVAATPRLAFGPRDNPVDEQDRERPEPRRIAERLAARIEAPQELRRPAQRRLAGQHRPGSPHARCREQHRGRARPPQGRLEHEQPDAEADRRQRSADDQPRPGERQIELRMGKDVRQLGHIGKDHRLAHRLALGVVGERQAGAERQHHEPGKYRPAGRDQQQAGGEQHRK